VAVPWSLWLIAVLLVAGARPAVAADPEPSNEGRPSEVTRALVKVLATKRLPDLMRPWSKQQPMEVTGSGLVIERNRILTSNHIVSYASSVLVQPEGSAEKFPVRVVAADWRIDVAILEPDDPAVLATHPPMTISDTLPDVGSAVAVYGYPTGGQSMSVTKGVVSRIEGDGFVTPH